tara:strand:- start:389 stop:1117 length:729 start_codon:yes stop_codon:yes gene_type:complete
MAGSYDNNFYAISPDGSLLFNIEADDDIVSSPSFLIGDSNVYIFFASDDGYLHVIDETGNTLDGWPILFDDTPGDVSFSDLDGDGLAEIVFGVANKIYAMRLDGSMFNSNHFPVYVDFPIQSAPIIADSDGDLDLEIIIGTSVNVEALDVLSQNAISQGFWNMHRGNNARSGSFEATIEDSDVQLGDVNFDGAIDVFDIILMVNIVIQVIDPDNDQFLAADVTEDGSVDVFDIISIVNIILD